MKKIFITLITFVVVIAGWLLLSPLFINKTVDEPALIQINQQSDKGEEQQPIMPITADIIIGQDVVMSEPMMEMKSTMSQELIGNFVDGDPFHQGSGDIKLIIDENKKFLRFENFSVTNGPDLFVTLNKGTSADRSEHVQVARLKGNQGNQNYDISEYNLDDYESISIYCRAFSVEFATAQI